MAVSRWRATRYKNSAGCFLRGTTCLSYITRKVAQQDLDYFCSLILAMDKSNLDNLKRMAMPEQIDKLGLFMDYSKTLMMMRFQTLITFGPWF